MSNVSVKDHPRDRLISITLASVSLVVGMVPLVLLAAAAMTQPLQRPRLASVILLAVPAGFIGTSLTIFAALLRRRVLAWRGVGRLNYVLMVLIVVLAAMIQAEAKAIVDVMIDRLGLRPGVANVLVLLPLIAGGFVFAFYWRAASPAASRATPEQDDPRQLGCLFGPIILVLLFVIAGKAYRDVMPLFTYSRTRATVDSATVETREGRRESRYVPRVYFTYYVAGQAYTGTRVTPSDLKGEKRWAERLVEQYQPGTNVTAYYDPEQPDRAFLRRSAGNFWGMLAGSLVIIGLLTHSILKSVMYRRRMHVNA